MKKRNFTESEWQHMKKRYTSDTYRSGMDSPTNRPTEPKGQRRSTDNHSVWRKAFSSQYENRIGNSELYAFLIRRNQKHSDIKRIPVRDHEFDKFIEFMDANFEYVGGGSPNNGVPVVYSKFPLWCNEI